jgi:hypothetical protein
MGATATAKATTVTVSHAPSGFSAKVPSGYRLRVVGGAYRITGGGLTATVRIVKTTRGARAYGLTLGRKGDTVLSSAGTTKRYRLVAAGKGQRRSVLVVRRGADLVVTIGLRPAAKPALAAVISRIESSVRGGTPGARATTPGAGGTAPGSTRLLALTPYRAPDGGATAWVPSDPDWTITSAQGALEGSGPRGIFLFGQTFSITLPGFAPPGSPPSLVVQPYASAIGGLESTWPLIAQSANVNIANVHVRQVIADATLPTFHSSGMLLFDFTFNGRPWVGVANVGTEDRLSPYQNFFWQMYISYIAVPADGDPTVGAALRLVWRSWNPSGAIAQRNTQARQILSEINDTWKGVAEFRSRTADQQSRDVSCLLRSGPFIDDHARELGLPPLLDCDSTYVRTG